MGRTRELASKERRIGESRAKGRNRFAVTTDNRIFNFLGDLTYPLFLTHSMTVAALFRPWEFANQLGQLLTAGAAYFGSPAIGGAALIAAILCVAIPVAAAVHFAIERPARRLVAMFLSHWISDRIPARA
jgi:peptidoglycan/LPS O-acetylase OafA/YrhL